MATYDWISLSEAKVAVSAKSSNTSNDTVIASVVSAASRRLDEAVGPAIQRVVLDEVHHGGNRAIELRSGPAISISSVVEYRYTGSVTLTRNAPGVNSYDGYSADRYTAQPELNLLSGLIYRTFNGQRGQFYCQQDNIVVSYLAGRYADTASVDPRFKEACKIVVKNWYRMYEFSAGSPPGGQFEQPTYNFPTFDMPRAARMLLRAEWIPEQGFGG